MEFIVKKIDYDEKYLRQTSEEVDFNKDSYMEWVNALKVYCQNHKVFALAPVQIGIPKRVIYLKNTTMDASKNEDANYDEEKILINPSIIRMEGHTQYLERCASCMDYAGIVDRPYLVEVEYYDIEGKKKKEVFKGFKSTVFCHEYDHLNGILHIDKVKEIMLLNLEEAKDYRAEHPYTILSKTGEFIYKL